MIKKNLLITWFFSYIFILLIPILFSIGIYSYTVNITKKETNKANDALLTQVKIEIDSRVEDIYKMFEQISLDQKVQIASNVKESFYSKDQYNLYSIVNDFKNYMVSNEYIKDAFIHFNYTGTVIGEYGHMSDQLFYHLYFKNQEYDLSGFQAHMRQTHYRTIQKIHKENGKKSIVFIQTTVHPNIGECPSTIVISMDETDLQDTLEHMKWNEENIVFILDSSNRVISTTAWEIDEYDFVYEEMQENQEPIYKKIMGTNYAVSIKDSKAAGWKYVALTPDFIFEKDARQIQIFTMTGLLLCILIGAGFSYFLAKNSYSPLKKIMEIFQKQGAPSYNNEKNEYKWLEEEVNSFFEDQKNTKNKLLHSKVTLKNYFISNLVKGNYDMDHIHDEMSEYNIQFHSEYNVVLLFYIEKVEDTGPKSDNYSRNLSLSKFIVRNIFEEAAGNHFNLEVVEIDDFVAAVINLPENREKYLGLLEETIYFVEQEVMEHFSIHMTVVVGDAHKGIEGISKSYADASEAMEYSSLLGGQELIYYHDIKNAQRRYYYPIEMEQKIINSIKVGNAKMAVSLIAEVFEENYVVNKISPDMGRCLVFDMLGTVIKVLDAEGNAGLLEQMDISKEISSKVPIHIMKNKFLRFVEEICGQIQRKHEENKDNALSEEVIEYIRNNYQNPDLNISMTGLHFNLTPAYISRLFKEQTGESLLNTINMIRIEAAKDLLQKGLSIVEVAEMVGYRSSGTLIRVFKKITGVTPGQHKKIL